MTGPADVLAETMVADWQAGRRHLSEHYIAQLPQPDAAAALELIAEELALRTDDPSATPATFDELQSRFPQWAAPLHKLFQFQIALSSTLAPQQLLASLQASDRFADFILGHEIGRGVRSRVFRAAQETLSGREVVLKIVPAGGAEHLTLARVQHTHIVPLYSVHDDRGLQALCMPDFGGTTLARRIAEPRWTPDDRMIALLGAALADALHFAHERELVHFDVKATNILVAADGTPMLLDFHLARPPLKAGDAPPEWLGGTPGCMAQEQEQALAAVRRRQPLPAAVDGRADVYALGLVLLEAGSKAVLPTDLHGILKRCIEPEPVRRYASAAALAADLRRHLADEPLAGVRTADVRERFRKWRRRRPRTLPVFLLLAALAAVCAALVLNHEKRVARAQATIAAADMLRSRGEFATAVETYHAAESQLEGVWFQERLRREVAGSIADVERRDLAARLHSFVQQLEPLAAAPTLGRAQIFQLWPHCRRLWSQRSVLAALKSDTIRDDLATFGLLYAETRWDFAPWETLQILDETEEVAGGSFALQVSRRRFALSLNQESIAAKAAAATEATPPRTVLDELAMGRAAMVLKDYTAAREAFDRAVALAPTLVWAHYNAGAASLAAKDGPAALASFSAAAALAPDSGWCRYNRALAYAACGQPARAAVDRARAVELDAALAALP